jgi:hypothetical protein
LRAEEAAGRARDGRRVRRGQVRRAMYNAVSTDP